MKLLPLQEKRNKNLILKALGATSLLNRNNINMGTKTVRVNAMGRSSR